MYIHLNILYYLDNKHQSHVFLRFRDIFSTKYINLLYSAGLGIFLNL